MITLPTFIQNWKNAIENGKSPSEISGGCYHDNAILKGTVWSEAVQGTKRIEDYFVHFTGGKNNANVTFTSITESPSGSFAGEYIFNWTDDNGQVQSADANYTFEPTQDGTLISLHHSSFFVEKAT